MFGLGGVAQTVGFRKLFRISIRSTKTGSLILWGDYTISPGRSLWHVTVRETFLDELGLGGAVGVGGAGTGYTGSTGGKKRGNPAAGTGDCPTR